MRVVASYLVLVELGNGDSGKNADDGNDNQQFYEGEAFCSFVGWMFMHGHSTRVPFLYFFPLSVLHIPVVKLYFVKSCIAPPSEVQPV